MAVASPAASACETWYASSRCSRLSEANCGAASASTFTPSTSAITEPGCGGVGVCTGPLASAGTPASGAGGASGSGRGALRHAQRVEMSSHPAERTSAFPSTGGAGSACDGRSAQARSIQRRSRLCLRRAERAGAEHPTEEQALPATGGARRRGASHGRAGSASDQRSAPARLLPTCETRFADTPPPRLASGPAAWVSVPDAKPPPPKRAFPKARQDMSTLTEEEVPRLFETAQSHGQFPPTKG